MKRTLALLLSLLFILTLAACGEDKPPAEDSPEPPALDGVFASEDAKLIFNGDGSSIALELSKDFAALSGLPAGRSEGAYVFLHHHEEYRYDKAEYFRIMINGKRYQFNNCIGTTDDDTVAFYIGEDAKLAVFFKAKSS